MAQYTKAPVYFVHQSTPGAVDLVTEARARGQEAYSETCPHYLTLDDTVYGSAFPEWYACCPPMRSAGNGRGAQGAAGRRCNPHRLLGPFLLRPVAEAGTHRGHPRHAARPSGRGNPDARHFHGHGSAGSCVEDFVEVFSAGPARINALPGKGIIAEGFDADLVLFDPSEQRTVDGGALHMGTDFSPFDGRTLAGWPAVVVSAGRVVLDR